ncbi:hypothetical protein WM36_02320 [Burkholderia ubonensis]|nr:hypothetical protein WM36_02320 [Burkholderia ubonensis]KVO56159.1 hypothetical protein WJ77_13815 [Burkholderia ubonensis]
MRIVVMRFAANGAIGGEKGLQRRNVWFTGQVAGACTEREFDRGSLSGRQCCVTRHGYFIIRNCFPERHDDLHGSKDGVFIFDFLLRHAFHH